MTKWRDEPVPDAEQGGLPGKKYCIENKDGDGTELVLQSNVHLLKAKLQDGKADSKLLCDMDWRIKQNDLITQRVRVPCVSCTNRRELILADASGPKSEAGQDDLCTCCVGALARLELFEHTVAALHDAAAPSCNPLHNHPCRAFPPSFTAGAHSPHVSAYPSTSHLHGVIG